MGMSRRTTLRSFENSDARLKPCIRHLLLLFQVALLEKAVQGLGASPAQHNRADARDSASAPSKQPEPAAAAAAEAAAEAAPPAQPAGEAAAAAAAAAAEPPAAQPVRQGLAALLPDPVPAMPVSQPPVDEGGALRSCVHTRAPVHTYDSHAHTYTRTHTHTHVHTCTHMYTHTHTHTRTHTRTDPGIEVLTIDKYQGRDKPCIILSFVRANDDLVSRGWSKTQSPMLLGVWTSCLHVSAGSKQGARHTPHLSPLHSFCFLARRRPPAGRLAAHQHWH